MDQSTPYETIKLDMQEGIAVVTMNRPEVRNALSKQAVEELGDVLGRLEEQHSTRAVILTGAGEKSFAAGADIAQLRERTLLDGLEGRMQKLCRTIEQYSKPTIAAVNGYALGGGCELAMACDIRISSDNGKFGLPELNLSIVPGAGGTQRLARLIGKGRALEMILTGQIIDAGKAEQIGLISRVVSRDRLLPEAVETARTIVAKGPIAVRLAKLAVHVGYEANMDTALVIERLAQSILYTTEDRTEGVNAFLERRRPNFEGK